MDKYFENSIPKKPFLRKGQGLIARFKIDPNSLKLENLPKYKYTARRKNFNLGKNKQVPKQPVTYEETSRVSISPKSSSTNITNELVRKELEVQKNANHEDTINSVTNTFQDNYDNVSNNLSLFEFLKNEENIICLNEIENLNLSRSERELDLMAKFKNLGIYPLSSDSPIESKNSDWETDEDDDIDEVQYIKLAKENSQKKVYFSDQLEVNEIEGPNNIEISGEFKNENSNVESLMLNKENVEQLIQTSYFGNLSPVKNTSDRNVLNEISEQSLTIQELNSENFANSDSNKICSDTNSEPIDILEAKLKELDQEIILFQNHNMDILKIKQKHELEKIKLQQERKELEKRFKEEKLQIEEFLQNVLLKIREEKKNFQRQIELAKCIPNERNKKVTDLKEHVNKLQEKLKNQENRHIASQKRLRKQIQSLEGQLKDLTLELDRLKKENKQLARNNAILSKENQRKSLKQINSIETLTTRGNKHLPANDIKKICFDDASESDDTSNYSLLDSVNKSKNNFVQPNKEVKHNAKDLNSNTSDFNAETQKSKEIIKNKHVSSKNSITKEIENADGSKDIWYANGNLKKVSSNGILIRMLYFNKDIKETNIEEGTVKYYYYDTNTWHTTYLDGTEVFEYPNGQKEHRYKDGKIETHYPNGSIQISNPKDESKSIEWRYPDGTIMIQSKTSDKILIFPSGQKEIHTDVHKRREYPDGTVKLIYPDGSQETRYKNGRMRLKDEHGNLVMDSANL